RIRAGGASASLAEALAQAGAGQGSPRAKAWEARGRLRAVGAPASLAEALAEAGGEAPRIKKGDYGETNVRDAECNGRGHRRTWVREVPADQGGDGRVRLLPAAS